LRTVLLEPIVTRLTALRVPLGAHLFWLPDSDSSLLPNHAIQLEQQPFLSRYTVHFIPSLYSGYTAQQRLSGQSSADHANRLLALINPTENLFYMPIEGEIVSHFFAPTSRTILQGAEGTLEQLQQALKTHPRYLHFSTHGNYNWSNPLDSGLALAKQTRWTLAELLTKTDLSGSRLVVLSACEMGITDINLPTEALGLATGFLQAGAPGVISTLWTVDDQSTTFLLGKFYDLHLNQGLGPMPLS
jgi:CHAT domain-containing protein